MLCSFVVVYVSRIDHGNVFTVTLFFYKKPIKRLSPQSVFKKWLLEPSKFLDGFLVSKFFY